MIARAELLPADRTLQLEAAQRAVHQLHESALARDIEGVDDALTAYEAAVYRLNGDTTFASRDSANPEAGGNVAERFCAAATGEFPMWEQKGKFLISEGGLRARVAIKEGFGRGGIILHFHVVDLYAPFISETGYRSHFDHIRLGVSPKEAAVEIFRDMLRKHRCYLKMDSMKWLSQNPSPDWVGDLREPEGNAPMEERDGQFALAF
jgi:hypothetical protein